MNWLKWRRFTYLFSGILLLLAVMPLALGKLQMGIEFTGGVEWRLTPQWSEEQPATESSITSQREEIQEVLTATQLAPNTLEVSPEGITMVLDELPETQRTLVLDALADRLGIPIVEARLQRIGPTFGRTLMIKTLLAVVLAAGATLVYVSLQFSHWQYGAAAVLAMLHDSFILIGIFGWLGWLYEAEVDILLITAVLTTLSFSLHDTIVMFDRIRELQRLHRGESLDTVANSAITQTSIRSLNNSLTILFMLLALVLLGGESLRWFALALLSGTVLGTYSSPFVAVPLYVDISQHATKRQGK